MFIDAKLPFVFRLWYWPIHNLSRVESVLSQSGKQMSRFRLQHTPTLTKNLVWVDQCLLWTGNTELTVNWTDTDTELNWTELWTELWIRLRFSSVQFILLWMKSEFSSVQSLSSQFRVFRLEKIPRKFRKYTGIFTILKIMLKIFVRTFGARTYIYYITHHFIDIL